MIHEQFLEHFLLQLEEIRRYQYDHRRAADIAKRALTRRPYKIQLGIPLWKQKDLPTGDRPKPSAALAFAEWLLACPDAEQAKTRTQKDQEGARSFLVFADQISENVAATLSDNTIKKYCDKPTPFFALSGIVIDFLELNKSNHPEEWD